MSNIPLSREILEYAIRNCDFDNPKIARDYLIYEIGEALKHMTREPMCKPRAKPIYIPITEKMKRKAEKLALDPRLSVAEISQAIGVRNHGRVSEILSGKR